MAAQTNTNNTTQTDPNIDVSSPYTPRRPAPIVSISINHPFATAARKIKNFLIHRQTLFATSFSIKVTPIVALVSLLGVAAVFGGGITTAYNFGKTVEQKFLASVPTPTPKIIIQNPIVSIVSKTGTIKTTYQLPVATPTEGQNTDGSESAAPATPTPLPVLHYILVSRSGSINYLASIKVALHNYVGLRVLVTGSFDSSTNILSIEKSTDIEILQ